jgi:hypothetical protein
MRAGRFFAVFGMVAILASSRVAHADLDNGEKSSAPKRVALDDFLESVSELKKLEDKPPASEEALRRRARPRSQPARRCRAQPRLLGRGILLRGRHSSRPGKGYGDGQAHRVTMSPRSRCWDPTDSRYRSPKTKRSCRTAHPTLRAGGRAYLRKARHDRQSAEPDNRLSRAARRRRPTSSGLAITARTLRVAVRLAGRGTLRE